MAVEHAGAERGLLILPHGEGQRVAAEATTGREGIAVRFVGEPPTPSALPGFDPEVRDCARRKP